jgi:hypothetical protein
MDIRIVSAMSTMDNWPIGLAIMLTWLSSVAIYNDHHCCHPYHPHLHEANMNVRYKAESYKYCYGPFRTRDAYVNGLVWCLSLSRTFLGSNRPCVSWCGLTGKDTIHSSSGPRSCSETLSVLRLYGYSAEMLATYHQQMLKKAPFSSSKHNLPQRAPKPALFSNLTNQLWKRSPRLLAHLESL